LACGANSLPPYARFCHSRCARFWLQEARLHFDNVYLKLASVTNRPRPGYYSQLPTVAYWYLRCPGKSFGWWLREGCLYITSILSYPAIQPLPQLAEQICNAMTSFFPFTRHVHLTISFPTYLHPPPQNISKVLYSSGSLRMTQYTSKP
jgi:hypothetical protein